MSVTNMFDMFCILLNDVKYINVGIKVVKQKVFFKTSENVTLRYSTLSRKQKSFFWRHIFPAGRKHVSTNVEIAIANMNLSIHVTSVAIRLTTDLNNILSCVENALRQLKPLYFACS